MKSLIYVIGGIHGKHELFEKLTHYYNPKIHQLILLGDLNDRGPRTKGCFLLGKRLVEETGAIYLRRDHEEYFLQFLQSPEDWYTPYMRGDGKETFENLIHPEASEEYSPIEISMTIQSKCSELIKFLVQYPLYYEWENHLLVHASVDLTKRDWRKTSLRGFIWIREPLHEGKSSTGKIIVFGHTTIPMLHRDMQVTDLWIQDHRIRMNSETVLGRSLHGVVFDKEGILQDIEYQNNERPWRGIWPVERIKEL